MELQVARAKYLYETYVKVDWAGDIPPPTWDQLTVQQQTAWGAVAGMASFVTPAPLVMTIKALCGHQGVASPLHRYVQSDITPEALDEMLAELKQWLLNTVIGGGLNGNV